MSEELRILVCGGRFYADRAIVRTVLTTVHLQYGVGILIHGGATGADSLCGEWAKSNGIHVAFVPALWDFYKGPAGPRRNSAMLLLQPAMLVAFPGGSGTADMVRKAEGAGLRVLKVQPNGDVAVDWCPNCDSPLPKGCAGTFKDDGDQCFLNRKMPIPSPSPPIATEGG